MARPRNEIGNGQRTTKELVVDLHRDAVELIREELALVRAEVTAMSSRLAQRGAAISAGAFLLYAGFLMLLTALTGFLTTLFMLLNWGPWLAFSTSACVLGLLAALAGWMVIDWNRQRIRNEPFNLARTEASLRGLFKDEG